MMSTKFKIYLNKTILVLDYGSCFATIKFHCTSDKPKKYLILFNSKHLKIDFDCYE